jgi:hypothetical protein
MNSYSAEKFEVACLAAGEKFAVLMAGTFYTELVSVSVFGFVLAFEFPIFTYTIV